MRRTYILAVFVAVAFVVPGFVRGAATAPLPRQPTLTLSVVGTNDLHGAVLPNAGRGGLALFGGYMRNLRAARARDGGGVVLVDAGDMFQGTLESSATEGSAIVSAYNALGYNAVAIGNHDFDFGPVGPSATPLTPTDDPRGALKARAAEAKFPFLAANIIDDATRLPIAWPNVRPSVLIDVAGVKVGIVGGATREELGGTSPANVRGLSQTPLAAALIAEATRLRAQGATVIVVTTHAGGWCTRFDDPQNLATCRTPSEITDVAAEIPRGLVDVIVAGHTHRDMAHEVNGIAVIESWFGGAEFGRVDLTIDRATGKASGRRIYPPRTICAREVPVTGACSPEPARGAVVAAAYEGAAVVVDDAIVAALAPAIARVATVKAGSLGVVLATPIRRRTGPESALGNLAADGVREAMPSADVVITTGLRFDLPAGPLTYGALYTAYTFDDYLVRLSLTGAELRKVVAATLAVPQTFAPGLSGIRVVAQCTNGALDVKMLRPTGAEIRDTEQVSVGVTEYLATGGSNGIFTSVTPPEGFPLAVAVPDLRDAVAEYLRRRGGTLRETDFAVPGEPRWSYPGVFPVTCR